MKNNSTTKHLLSSSFFNRTAITFPTGETLDVILSIEAEDGSGHNFNVTGYKGCIKKTIFVTTID
jgi:hypothetical protein